MHFITTYVCRHTRTPSNPFGWFDCIERDRRLTYDPFRCISWQHMSLGPLGTDFVGSMDFMTKYVPRGHRNPRDPFLFFECVNRGHRLTYDPIRWISWQLMLLGALGPLGTHLVCLNMWKAVIGHLWPLLTHFIKTYVPRGPKTPRDPFGWFEGIKRGHRLTYNLFFPFENNICP